MSSAEASIEIALPRARAWALLRDLGVAHRYVPGIVRTEIRSAEREGVGATRRVYRANGKGLDETVIAWEDGHGFLLRLHQGEGPPDAPFASATFRYRVDDVEGAPTRTRLTITLSYEPRWGALGRLLDRVVLTRAIGGVQQQLARRIKAYYESA